MNLNSLYSTKSVIKRMDMNRNENFNPSLSSTPVDTESISDINVDKNALMEPHNKITAVTKDFSSIVENTHIEPNEEVCDGSKKESMDSTNSHKQGQDNDQEYIEDNDQGNQDEEPDWGEISLHEPAKSDVPIFLSARNNRDNAHLRFGAALDECHASLKNSMDKLLSTAASIHHVQSEKLDELEIEIKQLLFENEDRRASMQKKLQESANAAHGLFSQLLMRVSQPSNTAYARIHQSDQCNRKIGMKDLLSGKRSLDVGEDRMHERKKLSIQEKNVK